MNTTELADKIAADHGLTKAEARKFIDSIFSMITDTTARGEDVSIGGFGKFKLKTSAAREGRNPSTGAAIKIPSSKRLTFAVAKATRDRLNG